VVTTRVVTTDLTTLVVSTTVTLWPLSTRKPPLFRAMHISGQVYLHLLRCGLTHELSYDIVYKVYNRWRWCTLQELPVGCLVEKQPPVLATLRRRLFYCTDCNRCLLRRKNPVLRHKIRKHRIGQHCQFASVCEHGQRLDICAVLC